MVLFFFICIGAANAENTNTTNGLNNGNSLNDSDKTVTIEISNDKILTPGNSSVSVSSYNTNKKPSKLSQSSIVEASKYVDSYVNKYKKLPNFVKISGYKFSMPEYLYLVSKTIQSKYKNNKSSIVVKYDVKDPQHIRGTGVYGNISLKKFYMYVKEVISYINYYKVAPNFVNTSIGSIQYQTLIFVFSKVLAKNQLPTTLYLNIASSNPLTKVTPKYTRSGTKNLLNSKYNGGKSKYLVATKNAQSKNSYIKKLSKKITKGCKTKLQKAKAIYYWVRDNIEYVDYYNTRYGAKKAISSKKGNCVDQSHAIVALCRAIKIPARYVHGNCKFVSGRWIGHVWTQILVGKKWYVADASHYELNGFGVVNNWNNNNYKLYNRYSSLPF